MTLVESRTKLVNSVRGIAQSHGIRFGPRGRTQWVAAVQECPAPLTSLADVLELNNDVRRVKRWRQMGAVVRCRPKQRDSGESSPELGITKAGKTMLRRLLVQSSQRILGPFCLDLDLQRWGWGLAARGKKRAKRRSVVALARKLAVVLHAMWLKNERWKPFRDEQAAAASSALAGQ